MYSVIGIVRIRHPQTGYDASGHFGIAGIFRFMLYLVVAIAKIKAYIFGYLNFISDIACCSRSLHRDQVGANRCGIVSELTVHMIVGIRCSCPRSSTEKYLIPPL